MQLHLYDQLYRFNKQIENKFRENWGSALVFLDGANFHNGKSYGEVELNNIIDEQIKDKFKNVNN